MRTLHVSCLHVLRLQGRCILLRYFLFIWVRILSTSACFGRCLWINDPSGIISSSTGGISKSANSGLLKTGLMTSSVKGTPIWVSNGSCTAFGFAALWTGCCLVSSCGSLSCWGTSDKGLGSKCLTGIGSSLVGWLAMGWGLALSVLSTSCLWGDPLCTAGLWFGTLPSFWSVGFWFGNWGIFLGTVIWDLGLFSNFILLSISFFFAIWLAGSFGLIRTLGFASADEGPLCLLDQLLAYHVQVLLQDPNISAHHVLGVVLLLLPLSCFW